MNAMEKAAGYLNVKPRTEKQVEKYLQDKGFKSNEICETIMQLKEYHFIDDYEFAAMFFETGFEKGHGISRIKRELAEKGVAKSIMEEVLAGLEDVPDQYEEALQIAGKAIKSLSGKYGSAEEMLEELTYEEKQKLQAKIARRLAARGFVGDIPFRAAREVTK